MNTSRRLFTMFLIAVSCLFAIQSAAALTAPVPGSSEEACVPIKSLPDNFPDWIEKPTCTFVQSDKNAVASASLCGDVGSLPGNRPQSSVLPAHAGSACTLDSSDDNAVASASLCGDTGQLPGNRPQSSVLPAHAGSACLLSQPGNTVAASTGTCSNIGPTVFNLGLGSATFASAPACVVVGVGPGNESGNATTVRVPIEGSITAMNGEPVVDNDDAASADNNNAPDIVRGKPSNIGPTI